MPNETIAQMTEDIKKITETLGVDASEDGGVAKRALEAKKAELNHDRKMRFVDGHDAPAIFVKRTQRPVEAYSLEDLALARMIFDARGAVLPDAMESRFQSLADKARKYTLTTGGTATGAELVDTMLWQQLFEDIHAQTQVANLFMRLDMTSGSMELPSIDEDEIIFYKPSGEGVAVTASDPATAERTLHAYTLKAQVDVSDEESEDAVVAMIIELRAKLARRAAAVIDSVILNGDTTGTTGNINKYGAAVVGTEDYLVGFDGLIHYCLVEVTGQATTEATLANTSFTKAIQLLGKYGDKPERLAFIIDRGVKNKALDLTDFKTADKIGSQATMLTGQIAQAYGSPVLLSGAILASDANGRIDGVTPGNNTKGRLILVNRDMWKLGFRRRISVAVERSEPKTLTSIVASFRMALQCYGDRSTATNKHTALLYNTTV